MNTTPQTFVQQALAAEREQWTGPWEVIHDPVEDEPMEMLAGAIAGVLLTFAGLGAWILVGLV
jgi:hypothetical protein